jgi:hypothetical protein
MKIDGMMMFIYNAQVIHVCAREQKVKRQESKNDREMIKVGKL